MSTQELSAKSGELSGRAAALSGYESQSLDQILENLCRIGVPTLHKMDRGWWMVLKMHVAAKGTEFTVKSEADCPSPLDAAVQCAARAAATLRQWSA